MKTTFISKRIFPISLIVLFFGLFSCGDDRPLETVSKVSLEKYMGTWYEIGRLPNRFEKDLVCVTANYTLNDDGTVKVTNRGKNTKKDAWQESEGEAKLPNPEKPGVLKVAFFKPFYGDYYIMELDKNYQYALVGSPSRDYLWILSRTKQLDSKTNRALLELAKAKGFDITQFEMTDQSCEN